ncbi:MAG: DUF2334 domain-containing protein [Nanoarchaeota archaeon]
MKKGSVEYISLWVIGIILALLLILFIIRKVSHTEIDDVSPEIECTQELLDKSDVLWVIPDYNNKLITEDRVWCDKIKSLNKKIGLHGVYHTYSEFLHKRDEKYLQKGIDDFTECFGKKPEMFKAPQLELSRENRKMIEKNGLKVKGKVNQIFHKVYHCSDTGKFSNRFIDLF